MKIRAMKILRMIMLVVLLALAGSTQADEVKVASISMMPGESKTLSVELENETTMIAFEFWMRLPEGVTIAKDEDGDFAVTKNSTRLGKHDLTVALDNDGRYHFLCYSNPIRNIKNNSGELLSIELVCAENVADGNYTGSIENVIFSDQDKNRIDLADCSFDVTIGTATIAGDVNNDTEITIADVTALVNIILGKDNGEPYEYNHKAADVNGDKAISVADVTALVNKILGR